MEQWSHNYDLQQFLYLAGLELLRIYDTNHLKQLLYMIIPDIITYVQNVALPQKLTRCLTKNNVYEKSAETRVHIRIQKQYYKRNGLHNHLDLTIIMYNNNDNVGLIGVQSRWNSHMEVFTMQFHKVLDELNIWHILKVQMYKTNLKIQKECKTRLTFKQQIYFCWHNFS